MQRLLGEQLTAREISEVVQEADVNGDGTVDFEGDLVWAQPLRDPPPTPPGGLPSQHSPPLFSQIGSEVWGRQGGRFLEVFVPALSAHVASKHS